MKLDVQAVSTKNARVFHSIQLFIDDILPMLLHGVGVT